MNFEELKALLKSGAITQAQFQAMCEKFGFEPEVEEEADGEGEDKENSKDKEEPDETEKLLEKKIQQAVDRATNKLGNDNKALRKELEKLRKEKLSAEELKVLEDEEKEKALAEREAAVLQAENKLYAVKAIKAAGLDDGSETALDILTLVNGADETTIDANIKALKTLVDKLVKAEVKKIFKDNGRIIENGGGGGGENNPYAKESFNLSKQMELEISNPQLAKKLKMAAGQ